MSDTPIDMGLDRRPSLRAPAFLDDRTEAFRDEYNDSLEETDLDDSVVDTFTLDSASDTYRRLIDLGLYYYHQHGLPFGFAFDPELLSDEDDVDCYCPVCGTDDPTAFRVGVGTIEDDVTFDQVRCLTCGESGKLGDYLITAPEPLFGPSE